MTRGTVLLLKNKTVPVDNYEVQFNNSSRYSPVFIPLLSHEPYHKPSTITFLQSPQFLRSTIFIIASQRGVEILSECMDEITDPTVKQTIYQKLGYAVGPATASQLLELGFTNIRGGENAGNGQKLSEIIIRDLSHELENDDHSFVFFTGEVHRDIIPKNLEQAGFNVDKRVIYTTNVRKDVLSNFNQFIDQYDKESKSYNWIVFFSPQGTEYIIDYIKQHQHQFKIGVIGPTTEEYLISHNIIPTIVSPKPDAISLYHSITTNDNNCSNK